MEDTLTEDNEVQEQEVVQDVPQRSNKDHNFDAAREVIRMQKEEIERLKATQNNQTAEVDEFADMDREDYIKAGKAMDLVDKRAEKIADAKVKAALQQYDQTQRLAMSENLMRSKVDDYDYVLQNFALPQINADPALAYRIQNSPDPAAAAYKLGKLSDDYEATMQKQQTSPKAEKILKNTQRPVSSGAVGAPLKSLADDVSKMSPQQIWETSQRYASGP